MTEQELRALVRDVVARHAGGPDESRPRALDAAPVPQRAAGLHASHHVFPLSRGGDDDGRCVIEPTVRCNHCGYCLSLGH